jgi:hypothetical protein
LGGDLAAMIPTGSYVTAVTHREVRDLADLGGASRSLGARWEQIGGAQVGMLVGQEVRSPSGERYQCQAVLRLDERAAVLSESAGRGLKSPDCLFAGHDRLGRLVIQPGDFKFTLDIATRDQIDPAPIRALLAGGGPLFAAALAELLAGTGDDLPAPQGAELVMALDTGRARLLPGFFLAPDEPSNRLFLRQAARRRRGGLTETDVHFLPVEGATFFAGLPGAEAAPLLREIDGLPREQDDFSSMTYYFQLGAAALGAFQLLHRPLLPLLGPEAVIDLTRHLRAAVASRPAMWSIDLVRDLAAPAIARRERLRLASRLANSPLRGRPVYEAIEAAGFQVADEAGPRAIDKPTLKVLLDRVDLLHGQTLAALLANRLLAGPFAGDEAVLAWLRETRPLLEEQGRAELGRLLAELRAQGSGIRDQGSGDEGVDH